MEAGRAVALSGLHPATKLRKIHKMLVSSVGCHVQPTQKQHHSRQLPDHRQQAVATWSSQLRTQSDYGASAGHCVWTANMRAHGHRAAQAIPVSRSGSLLARSLAWSKQGAPLLGVQAVRRCGV